MKWDTKIDIFGVLCTTVLISMFFGISFWTVFAVLFIAVIVIPNFKPVLRAIKKDLKGQKKGKAQKRKDALELERILKE